MVEWSDGRRLFEHLRDQAKPLRVADLPGYLRSLGLSPTPWTSRSLHGTPMRHLGEHLGNFFLSDKEDGEAFTGEDEEILVLFASQAATAVANARTYRDLERARADLEALIETSPVGVAVFDAGTGHPVSFNREARRIVEGLRTPGRPPEQLLEVITCRHSDGREVSLEELPLARQLGSATTMRAEEVELSVPDGRSVRMLINVTPIRSEEGGVVSVVVTMQDLAPLDELERQRAEFLGMVSHELRAPLTSIKGSTATVLGAVPVPPQAELLQFFRIIDGQADHMRGLIAKPSGRGKHRGGHSHRRARARERRRAGGPGQEHVPEWRRPARRPHRPAAGPAACDDRPGTHRAGDEQPLLERGPPRSRVLPDPGRGDVRGRLHRAPGLRTRAGGSRPTGSRSSSTSAPA